jgi:hypothetical protein
MAEESPLWDDATSKDRGPFRAKLGKRLGEMNDIDLNNREPEDVSRHVGFKYDSSNAAHKNLLTHLLNDGLAGSLYMGPEGKVSMHKALVEPFKNSQGSPVFDKTSKLWKEAMDSAGDTTFFGDKVKPSVAPVVQRKKVSVNRRPEMGDTFGPGMTRIDPELAAKAAAKEAAEKAKADAAEKAARLKERKRRLRED